MKTIILVRHSKAVSRTDEVADYYRSLKKKGNVESKEMANKFKELKLPVHLIISSPANRAIETARIFAEEFNYAEKDIKHEESIYFAYNGVKFLDFIHKCDDKHKTIMLFGHEPTLSEFASYLIKGFNYGMPKTSILAIDFEVDSWKDIEQETGNKKLFLVPADKNIEDYKLS